MNAEPGQRLVDSLQGAPPWSHATDDAELIETHLSWVLLVGPYAYKIKKPVDFGFVDFTTLERRRHFLEEELRLNRRFSNGWYLSIVPFYGTPDAPTLVDDGAEPFEYALKMRRFPQSALLTVMLPDETMVEKLADRVATFHQSPDAAIAPADTPYGTPETVLSVIEGNFRHAYEILPPGPLYERVRRLHQREMARFGSVRGMIARRKANGHIRELHGDLHRGNIAVIDGAPLLFDALEFNPSFRWIDPMAEVAFLVMDFYAEEAPWAARLFLNLYLEKTGDYDGLPLLPLYLCYRAMVRAKVALLSRPDDEPEDGPSIRRFLAYLSLAERLGMKHGPAKVILTHGLSGSGKSRFTRQLLLQMEGIRVRSDRERLRLYPQREGRYREGATDRVYGRLLDVSGLLLDAGYNAIVDAAFLTSRQRERFSSMAGERNVELVLLAFDDPGEETLIQRLERRDEDDPSEATPAVVALQREQADPLSEDELRRTYRVNADTSPQEIARLLAK